MKQRYALTERKKTDDRLKRIVRKRMLAISISIRYIVIPYSESGAWIIDERILLRREN